MIKKISLLVLAFFAFSNIFAQDYFIDFAAGGEASVIDSIVVENLMQQTDTTISGSVILQLLVTTGTDELRTDGDNSILLYPNPAVGSAKFEFELPEAGDLKIDLYDLNGRLISSTQNNLAAGTHYFSLNGLGSGIYMLNINSDIFNATAKVVSLENLNQATEIRLIGSTPNFVKKTAVINENKTLELPYTVGDRLLFRAYSADYTTILTLVPTESTTVTFDFVSITDSDGNNYAVVTIGDQVWMAENLRVTTYPNGEPIPHVTDNTEWADLDDDLGDAYCFYNNDSTLDYGALYSYGAAIGDGWANDNASGQGVCPDGWHLPTDNEWFELTDYLGSNSVAGGKMKETGTTHWLINHDASNESGFTALPGGYRNSDNGNFSSHGISGYFWSATEYVFTAAWYRKLSYSNGFIYREGGGKSYGFSVRCLRD